MSLMNEESLEALIVRQMTGCGWEQGAGSDYEPAYAIDLSHLKGRSPAARKGAPLLE